MAADRIRTGGAETIVAGGLETMSMIPMGGHIIRPNPYLVEHYPDFYLSMGLATENVARKYEVSREEQDAFALRSHQRAAAALEAALDAVSFRRGALESQLEAGTAAGEETAAALKACAHEEAELQGRLKRASEAVTGAEVAAQQVRDSTADAERDLPALEGLIRPS